MKKEQLQKRVTFFHALNGLDETDRIQYLEDCPEAVINIICEACHNLLKLELLSDQTEIRKRAKPIENYLKELSNAKIDVNRRRDLLKQEDIGNVLFSLLTMYVLPTLIKLLEK